EQLVDAVAAIARGATPSGDQVHIDDARGLRAPVGDTVLGALAGGSQSRAIELLRWHVGDVTLVTVPGEGFHAVERAVRASLGDAVILVGLAPDWHGYLPQPYTDGYEEGLSLGRDGVTEIVDALQRV